MKNLKKLFAKPYVFLFVIVCCAFFYPFLLWGKIPIPSDTVVGMYHPFRDVVWSGFTAGVPFKNPLITDPVRQQYVWRFLAIEQFKKGQLPLWNPYSFSGTPLLANFQSAVFYPLNIIFFALPFPIAWGILVFLQPLLSGLFLYAYLRNFKLHPFACFVGSIAFAFCGYAVAWLEWNTILHTLLWLPLSLLGIEKILVLMGSDSNFQFSISNFQFKIKKIIIWEFIFIASIVLSFFAGHLQVFFYSFIFTLLYTVIRLGMHSKNIRKSALIFVICYLLFTILTSVQWYPTLQFILSSARDLDQGSFLKAGWFVPVQNLIQYIAPDFFGNPATNNYWGVWNYGEFVGYIGILPLLFVMYALLHRRDKKTLFFLLFTVAGFLFALPTPAAELIYKWNIPFLSTSQPTRLLSVISFSLCVLAALGADLWIKEKNIKKTIVACVFPVLLLSLGWIYILVPGIFSTSSSPQNILVSRNNLVLPTILVSISTVCLFLAVLNKKMLSGKSIVYAIVAITVFDLFRFGWKFLPFSEEEWLYPKTHSTQLLHTTEPTRFLALDRRIMAPNFSVAYHLQDVSGYDPLYLKKYGQFVAAWERGVPDISAAAFNRIITPTNVVSPFTDLLGIKYVMSIDSLNNDKFKFIKAEGQTLVYENLRSFPRAFFVESVLKATGDQDEMNKLYDIQNKLRYTAVSQSDISVSENELSEIENATITGYSENQVDVNVQVLGNRLLILTDPYYPTWKVFIDGNEARLVPVDYFLRGVVVPDGNHTVQFRNDII